MAASRTGRLSTGIVNWFDVPRTNYRDGADRNGAWDMLRRYLPVNVTPPRPPKRPVLRRVRNLQPEKIDNAYRGNAHIFLGVIIKHVDTNKNVV